MKKLNWLALATWIALIPVLHSCNDDDRYSIGQLGITWATVRVLNGDAYYLESDDFGKLWVSSTDVYSYEPINGERVIVRFNPLVDNYGNYDLAIKLNSLRTVLTKSVENLTAENEHEYGNDPVIISQDNLWICNGYMNVIYRQNLPAQGIRHRVSLVQNTTVELEKDGYIHLEYRYNTYGSLTGYWQDNAVSFNLNSLDFNGKKGIKLKLNSATDGVVEWKLDVKNTTAPSTEKSLLNLTSKRDLLK